MLSPVESGAVLGQRRLSGVHLPPKRHKSSDLCQHTHAGGIKVPISSMIEMPLLQPHTAVCKHWLVSLFLLFCSRWLKLITGITYWKWASMCRCFCASLWMWSGKWVWSSGTPSHTDLKPYGIILFSPQHLLSFCGCDFECQTIKTNSVICHSHLVFLLSVIQMLFFSC